MAYRRPYGFISTFAAVMIVVIAPLSYAIEAVVDFARACLKVDPGISWQAMRTVKAIAFKVVAPLKREYQESYDTHGLSLDARSRC